MFTAPLNVNPFVANYPKFEWEINEDLMITGLQFAAANGGRELVNKFSHSFAEVLNKTFKGMIKKIIENPDTLTDYPKSIQAYYNNNKADIEKKVADFYKDEVKELTTELVQLKAQKEFKYWNKKEYEEWMRLPHFLLKLMKES